MPYFNGSIMHKTAHGRAEFRKEKKTLNLNVDKLQAALCIVASAAISITLLVLGIKPFI